MDDSLIIEIWDTFKEYVPEKNRDDAATHYVDWLLGKDFSSADLEDFMGYDPHLDEAISAITSDEDYDEEDYHEDDEVY